MGGVAYARTCVSCIVGSAPSGGRREGPRTDLDKVENQESRHQNPMKCHALDTSQHQRHTSIDQWHPHPCDEFRGLLEGPSFDDARQYYQHRQSCERKPHIAVGLSIVIEQIQPI